MVRKASAGSAAAPGSGTPRYGPCVVCVSVFADPETSQKKIRMDANTNFHTAGPNRCQHFKAAVVRGAVPYYPEDSSTPEGYLRDQARPNRSSNQDQVELWRECSNGHSFQAPTTTLATGISAIRSNYEWTHDPAKRCRLAYVKVEGGLRVYTAIATPSRNAETRLKNCNLDNPGGDASPQRHHGLVGTGRNRIL